MKKEFKFTIICFILTSVNCNLKKEVNNLQYNRIEFINNAGYIKLPVDSFFNDTYLEFDYYCGAASWQHIIKNKILPRRQKTDSLLKENCKTISYLSISYPNTNIQIISLQEADSIAVNLESKRSPIFKKSYIEKLGKNEFVISDAYVTDQKKLPIDSNINSYQCISAYNNISIGFCSNMYNVKQFQNYFRNIIANIEFQLDRNKLNFQANSIDSIILTYNKTNQYLYNSENK